MEKRVRVVVESVADMVSATYIVTLVCKVLVIKVVVPQTFSFYFTSQFVSISIPEIVKDALSYLD